MTSNSPWYKPGVDILRPCWSLGLAAHGSNLALTITGRAQSCSDSNTSSSELVVKTCEPLERSQSVASLGLEPSEQSR